MGERFAIGVDFGGTKISAGVVDLDTGKLLAAAKKKTRQVHEEADVVKRLIGVIDEALQDANADRKKIVGIGIGVAGMVDRQKGVVLDAVNIGSVDLPLTEPLSAHYKWPTYLGNDVEVATLGELHFGAGRSCSNFICIFVGTGIGSGIVLNNKIIYGASGTAGEIGHMLLMPEGKLCGCGGYGCLEAYASRTALAKNILVDLNRGMESSIRDKIDMTKGILRAKAIANAITAGDQLVVTNVTECARYFGMGLASIINFYNPERIIVGGGLVEAVDLYLQVATREAKRRALKIPGRKVQIVKAELGDFAGVIGAAMLTQGQGRQLSAADTAPHVFR
jgi:glucokinase